MVVQYTRYRVDENRRQAFIDAHREASRHLQFRCLRFELTHCTEQGEGYTLRIEWESPEDLRRFAGGTAGNAFRQALSGFARDVQEQRQWDLTDVVQDPLASGSGLAEGFEALPTRPPWDRLYPWIMEHLQEKILVEQMAERVNMSPRNFARVFHRDFQVPPGEFLDRVRVAAAKRDLEKGVQSVDQIAAGRGFGSSSTMRRAFLRVTGMGPSQYRHRIRSRAGAGPAPALGFPIPQTFTAVSSSLVMPSRQAVQ